jgi:hypothetical protein
VRVRQYYQDLIVGGEFPQLSSVGPPEPTSAADRDRFFVAKNLQCSPPTARGPLRAAEAPWFRGRHV